MRRIAEDIKKAVWNALKGSEPMPKGRRYYESNARGRVDVTLGDKEGNSVRGEQALDWAYASAANTKEIQYC